MQKTRATLSLIIIILLLAVFIFKRWQEPPQREVFDRTPDELVYTKHALCRMDCRQISREDINEILKKGIINLNRSDKYDRPCPSFALQGETSDGEKLRVIFAQCPDVTKVVTCYNLEKDFNCNCPGDPVKGSGK